MLVSVCRLEDAYREETRAPAPPKAEEPRAPAPPKAEKPRAPARRAARGTPAPGEAAMWLVALLLFVLVVLLAYLISVQAQWVRVMRWRALAGSRDMGGAIWAGGR